MVYFDLVAWQECLSNWLAFAIDSTAFLIGIDCLLLGVLLYNKCNYFGYAEYQKSLGTGNEKQTAYYRITRAFAEG